MNPPFEDHVFASALREERWTIANGAIKTLEHGEAGHALTTWNGSLLSVRASTSFGRDRYPVCEISPRDLSEQLALFHERLDVSQIQERIVPGGRIDLHWRSEVRIVARGSTVKTGRCALIVASVVSDGKVESVVTTPQDLVNDVERLGRFRRDLSAVDVAKFPLLWKMGSGSVLLHELVGHASEDGITTSELPSWLFVHDEPERSGFITLSDDTGNSPEVAELSAGAKPQAFRRETFRDPPIRRMTNVVVRHNEAPFDRPEERIEIFRVEGGSFDPLRDDVTLRVSESYLVQGTARAELAPFQFRVARSSAIAMISGASGAVVRYPGVICSREGQKLPVGSWSPDLLMRAGAF